MSQVEYDLNDMELLHSGSTTPEKRKIRVHINRIDMERGVSFDTLLTTMTQAQERIDMGQFTDKRAIINIYDRGDGQEGIELVITAKREETDMEYQDRLKRIENAKLKKREFDLKKFYELKAQLGL